MSIGETNQLAIGNVTKDPEIRFNPDGSQVANFSIACNKRIFDRQTNEWKDGPTTFINVVAWRGLAENVVESLVKGTTVIVYGPLVQRSYETREGEKRTVYEVRAEHVAVDLTFQTAKVSKANRSGGGSAPAAQQSAPRTQQRPAAAPAGAPAGGGGGFPLDEPPF